MPDKFPKSMGACADLLYKYREERLQADRDASELKAREQRLIDYIVDNLDKDSGGAVGKTHKVEVIREEKPTVKDWPLMFAYIAKNKAWDMVQRRINPAALQARIDDGKTIPGWEPFMVVKVSLTKRGR
jgi:hypothetical protein